jgi:hypothetical protein
VADDQSTPATISTKARLLRSAPALTVRELAIRWAAELGEDDEVELARWLANHLLHWPADRPEPPDVLVFDSNTARPTKLPLPTFWARVERFGAMEGVGANELLWWSVKNGLLMIAREDLWKFCEETGLPPPSFWPRPPQSAPATVPPSESDTTAEKFPTKPTRQARRGKPKQRMLEDMEAIQRAKRHSGAKLLTADELANKLDIPRDQARELTKDLPPKLRPAIGRPRKSAGENPPDKKSAE